MTSKVYSFLDVQAAIVGPGGGFSIGVGAAVAEEGITIDYTGDLNTMQIGADGEGQHSLSANRSGRISVRILKTSPTNQQLMAMMEFQAASASLHGQNTITIHDSNRGDTITARQVAFAKRPSNTYAAQAGMMEWLFDAVKIDGALGE